MARAAYDAVVIGAGPNGLAAAITVAEAGRSVLVIEAAETVGGSTRTEPLTLPGFVHDVCSAIHPMASGSPCFARWPLQSHGLEWIHPPAPLAHPLDDRGAVMMERSLDRTCAELGEDGAGWRRLFRPILADWEALKPSLLGPLRLPRHPFMMARFGLQAMRPATAVARSFFEGQRGRALFAGLAAHAILPLDMPFSSAVGLVLGAAGHTAGWPLSRGGSQHVSLALAGYLRSLGGEIETGRRVQSLAELPSSRAVLCDIAPRELARIGAAALPAGFVRKLASYRYGPAAFKVDWALDGPIPWRAPECLRAGTVHVGGTLEEIAVSERDAWEGRVTERPYVLLAQQSLFDDTRAPAGKHTSWGYCHVPNGCTVDMTDRIEQQIERFAPGFRDRILARSVLPPAALEARNPNLVGGDIAGGAQDLPQLFTRPTWRTYGTPLPGLYLCSASTPPGGGVHGMCGFFAARAALRSCL